MSHAAKCSLLQHREGAWRIPFYKEHRILNCMASLAVEAIPENKRGSCLCRLSSHPSSDILRRSASFLSNTANILSFMARLLWRGRCDRRLCNANFREISRPEPKVSGTLLFLTPPWQTTMAAEEPDRPVVGVNKYSCHLVSSFIFCRRPPDFKRSALIRWTDGYFASYTSWTSYSWIRTRETLSDKKAKAIYSSSAGQWAIRHGSESTIWDIFGRSVQAIWLERRLNQINGGGYLKPVLRVRRASWRRATHSFWRQFVFSFASAPVLQSSPHVLIAKSSILSSNLLET